MDRGGIWKTKQKAFKSRLGAMLRRMNESISVTEGGDNKHIVLEVSQGNSPIGKIAIVEDHPKDSKKIPIDDGINITAWLVFDFNKTEDVLTEIIKQALLYIKGIEGDDLIFEKLKIKPETDNNELKIAATNIGFTQNGSEELYLLREKFLELTEGNGNNTANQIDTNNKPENSMKRIPAKKPLPTLHASRDIQISILTALLDKSKGTLQAELSKATGINISTIRTIIKEFKNARLLKLVKNSGNSYTVIPDAGKIRKVLIDAGVEVPEIPIEEESINTEAEIKISPVQAIENISRNDPKIIDNQTINAPAANAQTIEELFRENLKRNDILASDDIIEIALEMIRLLPRDGKVTVEKLQKIIGCRYIPADCASQILSEANIVERNREDGLRVIWLKKEINNP